MTLALSRALSCHAPQGQILGTVSQLAVPLLDDVVAQCGVAIEQRYGAFSR